MNCRWLRTGCSFLFSFILFACSTNTVDNSFPNVTESTKETSKSSLSKESAKRVVALTSLSVDIVGRLAPQKLVGISESPLFQEDNRFKNLSKVSAGRTQPNLEKIIALKPDLVIGAVGFHDQILAKLEDLGVATITSKMDSWNSLLNFTRTLAKAIGADPNPLISRYQTFLEDVPDSNPSALLLVSTQPILSPNKNSWAGDLLNRLKVRNVATNLQGKSPIGGYITLSAEKIIQENPEVILIVDREGEGLLEKFKSQPFWNQLQAVRGDRVYVFDYFGLVNPGSIDKIEQACTKLKQVLANK